MRHERKPHATHPHPAPCPHQRVKKVRKSPFTLRLPPDVKGDREVPPSLPSDRAQQGPGHPPTVAALGSRREPQPHYRLPPPKGISFCPKPLPPPYFLLFMGGKARVSNQKDPKIHMSFQVEPAAKPSASQKFPRASLSQPHPHRAEGETPTSQNPGPATKATGLSASRLSRRPTWGWGGDAGAPRGWNPKSNDTGEFRCGSVG